MRRFFIFFLLLSSYAFADREAPAHQMVKFSENKSFYVEMNPATSNSFHTYKGQAKVYKASSKELVWSTDWYGQSEISNDGKYLVGQGKWGLDDKNLSDLAVILFKEGQLLKQYQVSDLFKDKNAVDRTISHYFWKKSGEFFNEKEYKLTLLDGSVYVFDLESGEIKSSQ